MRVSKTCHTFHVNFAVSFFILSIFILFCIAVVWTGCLHLLGSCRFWGVWAICLRHKGGGISYLVLCPRTQQANLLACFLQHPLNAECQAVKLWVPLFKVFLVWLDKGNIPQVYQLWSRFSNQYTTMLQLQCLWKNVHLRGMPARLCKTQSLYQSTDLLICLADRLIS